MAQTARPLSVVATAATGVAQRQEIDTEDTISLNVSWQNVKSGNLGTATYTSSWIAPPSDVHSQQRFFYMGHHGEVTVDQAHRGFTVATDQGGFASANPLFMKYEPSSDGRFVGQDGYGYRSIADFVQAACAIRAGVHTEDEYHGELATAKDTVLVTAILEAGRRSLDLGGEKVCLVYDNDELIGFDR